MQFRKRTQTHSELVLHYVAALRDLVSKCEFGANTDDMISDQLIENIASHRIQERLWLLETDLTLSKAITIATQIEAASAHAKSITGDQATSVQAVQSWSCDTGGQRRHNSSPLSLHPLAIYCQHRLPTHATAVGLINIWPMHKTALLSVQNVKTARKRDILLVCVDQPTHVQCMRFTCRSIPFFTCMTKQSQLRLCAPFP